MALLAGQNHEHLRQTTQRLEVAWFCWKATSLAANTDSDVDWDFSTAANLERALEKCVPLVRPQHLRGIVEHVPRCPVCSRRLALTVDGKTTKSHN